MKLELGVVDHIDKQDRPVHSTYDDRMKLMRLYDEAGFRTFHLTEHHATPLGLAPSPLIFLAAASRLTTRIRFAPLVLIFTLYEPLRLAAEICMLDHLTKGRFEIGGGRGISPYELAYFNVSHLEAPEIFREAMQVVMMALTQDAVDHRGRHFTYRNVPIVLRPYQQPHPPIWTATGNPASAERAGAMGHHVCFLQPVERSRTLVQHYLKGWNEAHPGQGRPKALIGLTRFIFVAENETEAREKAFDGYRVWHEKYAYLWRLNDPRPDMSEQQMQMTYPHAMIAGTPEQVRAEIERQVHATGVNYFVTRFAYGNLSFEESARSLALFTREVMPALREVEIEPPAPAQAVS